MTSEILNDYNRQIEQEEICYKNNRDKTHDWEQTNTEQISRNILELEYYCVYVPVLNILIPTLRTLKLTYNRKKDKNKRRKMKVGRTTTLLFIKP